MGEFEILGVCFSKEDMDIGSLRKIGLLENNGRVHDIMYFFFLGEKKEKEKWWTLLLENGFTDRWNSLEIGSLMELCGLPY